MKQVIDLTSTPTPPKARSFTKPNAPEPQLNPPKRSFAFDQSKIDPGFWDERSNSDDYVPKKTKSKKRVLFDSGSESSESPEEYDISSDSEDSESWIERETPSSSQTPHDFLVADFDAPFRRENGRALMDLPTPSLNEREREALSRTFFGSDSQDSGSADERNPFMIDHHDGGEQQDVLMQEQPERPPREDEEVLVLEEPRDKRSTRPEKPTLRRDRDTRVPPRRILEIDEDMPEEEWMEPRVSTLRPRPHLPQQREPLTYSESRSRPPTRLSSSRFDPPRSEARRPIHATSSLSLDRPIQRTIPRPRPSRDWSPPPHDSYISPRSSSDPALRKRFRDDFDDDLEPRYVNSSRSFDRRKKPKNDEPSTDSDALLARRLQMQEYGQPSYRAMPTPSPMFIPQLGGPMGAPSFMLHPHMMPHHFSSLADFHRQLAPHFHHHPPPRHSNPLYNLQYRKGDFTADDYEMLLALDKDVKKKTLSKKQISGIKPKILKNKTDETECVICLDMCTVGSKVKILTCTHSFHAECIDKWLNESKACPICKAEVA